VSDAFELLRAVAGMAAASVALVGRPEHERDHSQVIITRADLCRYADALADLIARCERQSIANDSLAGALGDAMEEIARLRDAAMEAVAGWEDLASSEGTGEEGAAKMRAKLAAGSGKKIGAESFPAEKREAGSVAAPPAQGPEITKQSR
jgi:hypothetical protein